MARPTGLEPATTGSTVRYSNQLSYGPARMYGSTSPRGECGSYPSAIAVSTFFCQGARSGIGARQPCNGAPLRGVRLQCAQACGAGGGASPTACRLSERGRPQSRVHYDGERRCTAGRCAIAQERDARAVTGKRCSAASECRPGSREQLDGGGDHRDRDGEADPARAAGRRLEAGADPAAGAHAEGEQGAARPVDLAVSRVDRE